MDKHFIDESGNHFVATDVPEDYTRDGATEIEPPPSPDHIWGDGEWVLLPPPATPNLSPLAPWQFWAMLRMSGHENAVLEFVSELEDPQKAIATSMLEYSLEYRRDHPLVESMRQALTLEPGQLDALWDQAHQLVI